MPSRLAGLLCAGAAALALPAHAQFANLKLGHAHAYAVGDGPRADPHTIAYVLIPMARETCAQRRPANRPTGMVATPRNDEEPPMTGINAERPDPYRLELLRRVFEPSCLDDVAEAVAVATEYERHVYVERVEGGYRWSLTHPGGSYPLLRITARFLRTDYTHLAVAFRTLTDDTYVLCADPQEQTTPKAWAILDFDRPTSPDTTSERIQLALSSET